MKIKFKRLLFIWLGIGLILTSILYLYQRDRNYGKSFPLSSDGRQYVNPKPISEKVTTYYEYVGVLTVGGALVILGLGFKND